LAEIAPTTGGDAAIVGHDLNAALKRLALGEDRAGKRMKALRF
jgi:hypothetical protein